MKTKSIFSIIFLLLIIQVGFGQADHKKILNLIKSVPKITVPEPSHNVIMPRHSIGFEGQGSNRVETFEEKDNLTQTMEQLVVFNPNADALFPSSLIQGKSLQDGVLSPISAERNPITITVSDLVRSDLNASYSVKIKNPTFATITDGIHSIVNQKLQQEQPARISYTVTEMNSVEEGMLKLGASAKWMSGVVSGSFSTSTSNMKSRFMVRYVQSYYTVSCEAPANPAAFISKKQSFDDFKTYVGLQNPTTYISSVTYGREFWMLIESNHESSETKEALDAAFSGGFGSATINLSANQKKVLDESSVQILAIGGGGSGAIKPISSNPIEGLKGYLLSGANYSSSSPGVIISYTVRYLLDNSVARVSSFADYTIRTSMNVSERTLTNLQFTFNTGNDDKDDDNHVGIRFTLLPKNIVLFENGDLRPRQPEDSDPTWHDDRSVNVQINSIAQQIFEHDPQAKQIKVEVWKSGGAHWHFGYDFYIVLGGGIKVELGHKDSNNYNFGDGYNREQWVYNIPW